MKNLIQKQKITISLASSLLFFFVGLMATGLIVRLRDNTNLTPQEVDLPPRPNLNWEVLTSELQNAAQRFPGQMAIYIRDLQTNKEFSFNPDKLFPSASLIKVPIMACVFKKIKEDSLTLLTPIKLKKEYRTGGSGTLKWHANGSKFAVGELLYRMITESDNIALKMLVGALGKNYIQEAFRDFGLTATNFYEEGLSLSGQPVANENFTTAREMGNLLEKIYRGDLIEAQSSSLMLEFLKEQKHMDRLGRTLPTGWMLANKTGLLRRACHDAGIVFTPTGKNYVLVVLTWKAPNYKFAKHSIAKIGRVTYRYFSGEHDLAQSAKNPQLAKL